MNVTGIHLGFPMGGGDATETNFRAFTLLILKENVMG